MSHYHHALKEKRQATLVHLEERQMTSYEALSLALQTLEVVIAFAALIIAKKG